MRIKVRPARPPDIWRFSPQKANEHWDRLEFPAEADRARARAARGEWGIRDAVAAAAAAAAARGR